MISEAYIRDWQAKAPWRDWARVEQDLIICRTVVEIFRHPVFTSDLSDLLPSGEHFDFADGFHVVEREIMPRL